MASILFIQVPGPSLLFTIGRALTVGRRDALLSVVGNALGITVQVFLIALGLAAVVTASATAYTVVKVAGASYVIWLGIQAIRHRADARAALGRPTATTGRGRALRTGLVVGLTNPKTIVFFVAFLPQFVNAEAGHVGLQMAALRDRLRRPGHLLGLGLGPGGSQGARLVRPQASAPGHARRDRWRDDGRPRRDHAHPGLTAGPSVIVPAVADSRLGDLRRLRSVLRTARQRHSSLSLTVRDRPMTGAIVTPCLWSPRSVRGARGTSSTSPTATRSSAST